MNIINLRKQGSITNFGVNLNEKIIMFTPKFAILLYEFYIFGTIVLKSIALRATSHLPTCIFLIILPSPKSSKSVRDRLLRILFRLPKLFEDNRKASKGSHSLQ